MVKGSDEMAYQHANGQSVNRITENRIWETTQSTTLISKAIKSREIFTGGMFHIFTNFQSSIIAGQNRSCTSGFQGNNLVRKMQKTTQE